MARICREYGMSYRDCLQLPLKTFWSFNRQIDRLRAEEEQRQLQVIGAAQAGEAASKLQDQLRHELGEPVATETTFNATRFEELKQKFKGLK